MSEIQHQHFSLVFSDKLQRAQNYIKISDFCYNFYCFQIYPRETSMLNSHTLNEVY